MTNLIVTTQTHDNLYSKERIAHQQSAAQYVRDKPANASHRFGEMLATLRHESITQQFPQLPLFQRVL
jgi:hypothetical protein